MGRFYTGTYHMSTIQVEGGFLWYNSSMPRPRSPERVTGQDITRILRERLESGQYGPGDFLPPERKLSQEFSVTRPTLRRALEPLVKDGLLIQHAGLGTRVPVPIAAAPKAAQHGWKIIALVLPDIANRFFAEITEAVEYAALQRGYQLLLCNSRHSPAVEDIHLRQLAATGVSGVILGHDPNREFPAGMRSLEDASIPAVFLFSSPRAALYDSVMLDEAGGVEQVMRYLLSLGHTKIAFLRAIPGERPHPREQAFRAVVQRGGGQVDERLIVPYENCDDGRCQNTLEQLLSLSPPPTAIFAGNDRMALVVLKHLAAMGVKVPQELSVIGFDNLRLIEHLPVALTTVDQPKLEMGRRASEMLFERIEMGDCGPPRGEMFQSRLIIRDSCAIAHPILNGFSAVTPSVTATRES
jgi:DNA-binding LacI/PurR family transcriptional regulator